MSDTEEARVPRADYDDEVRKLARQGKVAIDRREDGDDYIVTLRQAVETR